MSHISDEPMTPAIKTLIDAAVAYRDWWRRDFAGLDLNLDPVVASLIKAVDAAFSYIPPDPVVVARENLRRSVAEAVDHPAHYGGAGNPYEAIKVIEAWRLGFNLGNTAKYISRAGKKGAAIEDLKKARWYLDREISNLEKSVG